MVPPIRLGFHNALAQEHFAIGLVGVEYEQVRARFHQAIQRQPVLLVPQKHILRGEIASHEMGVLLFEHPQRNHVALEAPPGEPACGLWKLRN